MAQNSSSSSSGTLLVLVALLILLLHDSCEEGLCNGVQDCHHNQSDLCRSDFPISCRHQLGDAEYKHGSCHIERIAPDDCYMEAPSFLAEPNDLPFNMQMYYYRTWMESRATTNLTFPTPTWKSVKFRYQGREEPKQILCRKFLVDNVSLPLSGNLMWDCLFFNSDDYSDHSFDLSVITSEGEGGKFAFRVPEKMRFDPINTRLKDWQVFFYLHLDHVQRSASLPVTLQLAPFENLAYNLSLLKCLDSDHLCSQHSILSSVGLDPKNYTVTSNDARQITELLPSWSNPAAYAVSVQIISPECPDGGCFLSISPVFEIKESQVSLWLCVAFGFIFIFALAFTITHHHRTKENAKLLQALKQNPPSVLLLYLPENHPCLDLVKMFANFLKDTAHVHPYVIDVDVGSKNPNNWTSEHMNKADRILFIVPGNPNGDSVTPIRDQWLYSLQYLSGHHFITHHVAKKVAVILLPFSADVPYKIAHVQRFDIIGDMASLLTWIHDGSWLDKKLLWGPQIRSSMKNEGSHSIVDLTQLVNQASQVTKCHKGLVNGFPKQKYPCTSDFSNDADSTSQLKYANDNDECDISKARDFGDIILKCESESEFDPSIPDVQDLLINKVENQEMDESDLSSEYSDIDDSHFL